MVFACCCYTTVLLHSCITVLLYCCYDPSESIPIVSSYLMVHLSSLSLHSHLPTETRTTTGSSQSNTFKMVVIDGHELAFYSTLFGFYSITTNTLGKGWFKRMCHLHPVVGFAVCLGGAGLLMPLTVVPIRRAIGLPTHQYKPMAPGVVFPKYADINAK